MKEVFTSVNQYSIFKHRPFLVKKTKYGGKEIGINHLSVLRNFMRGSKTFGESRNLRKLFQANFTLEEFEELKASEIDVIVIFSNLSLNQV